MTIYLAAKEREKAGKLAQQKKIAEASAKVTKKNPSGLPKPASVTSRTVDSRELDLSALNIQPSEENRQQVDEPPPKIAIARERLIEEVKVAFENKNEKKNISLVVIGRTPPSDVKDPSHHIL